MIEQPELWNAPHPSTLPQTRPMVRRDDLDTSRDAAVLAFVGAKTLRDQCLAALREHGPLTDFQLADLLGRQQTSVGKRRGELVECGEVVQVFDVDGKPLRRLTPSGATAMVWRAVAS